MLAKTSFWTRLFKPCILLKTRKKPSVVTIRIYGNFREVEMRNTFLLMVFKMHAPNDTKTLKKTQKIQLEFLNEKNEKFIPPEINSTS